MKLINKIDLKAKTLLNKYYYMTTKKTSKDLIFPNFEDIKVSTKTFIVATNLRLDLKKLFDVLPITDYNVIPKKRGRKKKFETIDEKIIIESGSIVTMKYENEIKGVELKPKKHNKKKKSKWFRNSFTVVMIIDNKPINFKLCSNGVIQCTGCKFDSQVEDCIKYIWYYIKENKDIYSFTTHDYLEALFIPVMRNIDFSVGFTVDREKLSKYMSTQTEFHSLLETSFGYTGVNIKLPIVTDIEKMEIKKISFKDSKYIEEMTTYSEYLKRLSDKERMKKLNKTRYNTFLIFHSGRAIYSGCTEETMRDSYYYFLKIIRTAYDVIEERLDT